MILKIISVSFVIGAIWMSIDRYMNLGEFGSTGSSFLLISAIAIWEASVIGELKTKIKELQK